MHLSKTLVAAFSFAAVSTAIVIDGAPDVNSSAVQKHLQDRSALITLEKRQRQDHAFRQNLSAVARQADAIVDAIRQHEIDSFWRVSGTVEDEDRERFAGEMFPKAKPLIPDTQLWNIVKRMPKGALLHAHLAAMLPFEILLDAVMNTEGMVVSVSQPVMSEVSQKNASVTFAHVNHTIAASGPAIDSTDYMPNTQLPVKYAAQSFAGGEKAFGEFVLSKVQIQPEDSIRHDLGVDEIWRIFQAAFDPADSMMSYEPILRTFYQRLFAALVDDGINWVEIRASASTGILVHEGEEDADPNLDVYWQVLVEELEGFKQTDKGENFWGARVIWSDIRSENRTALTNRTLTAPGMKVALGRKAKFPELISGYDLVGQEDLGRPLADVTPELVWFREQAERLNLTIPFFFHAGETLGDGNSTDYNLVDAILFNTRRIGHGFSLYKHPQLIDEVITNSIMVEVCPISNEVLRLATDILHHPLPAMIAHGIATAISNDDPAILGQDAAGLSYDFYQTIQGFDNIGLAGLGALAQNSLRWANFEDQSDADWVRDIDLGEQGTGIKAQYMQVWNQQWEDFCQWVVDEYGSEWLNATIDMTSTA
ncbi:adenosine deaminase family protein [Aspergillus saccharolyticus JOP 1030-1]|uniref:adenosine deaminase n=1 Tax=Aspergillus saccharolyticus JOP 1030-1 TaxID=1450539 RepID=A0A318ZQB2_9EURO|nr:adenosine deaminase family protein [Aspergillus saccharolyticus JOP 1030-1]PYH48724.1 adenosine deaminase family protein [Aspergillus saccharolyticus JOP 1030-1]